MLGNDWGFCHTAERNLGKLAHLCAAEPLHAGTPCDAGAQVAAISGPSGRRRSRAAGACVRASASASAGTRRQGRSGTDLGGDGAKLAEQADDRLAAVVEDAAQVALHEQAVGDLAEHAEGERIADTVAGQRAV